MRKWAATILSALCIVTVAACSFSHQPPVGRWEGTYESDDDMVVVRVEIVQNGTLSVSAPDAMDIGGVPADQRGPMRERLAASLASSWGSVEGRTMDFDGRVFRKPGGIAPQMEWNPDSKTMTAVIYLGMKTTRIPLRAVKDFSADPWSA
jgi:hypothetical protein